MFDRTRANPKVAGYQTIQTSNTQDRMVTKRAISSIYLQAKLAGIEELAHVTGAVAPVEPRAR